MDAPSSPTLQPDVAARGAVPVVDPPAAGAGEPPASDAGPVDAPRNSGLSAFQRPHWLGDTLFVVLSVSFVLLMFRWYLSARASLIPALVTPQMDFNKASRPGLAAISGRMKDMALQRVGLKAKESRHAVAFTFDDGPYPLFTPVLLDMLARNKCKATFFVVGRDAQMQPEIMRRIVAEGHELANHSYTHASFQDLDLNGIRDELEKTDLLLQALTGQRCRFMRAPGGRLDPSRLGLIQSMGYTVALDNINPGDWRENDPLRIYNYTLWRSVNNAVVLLHSGRPATIRAMPTIIDAYRKKGYDFVTLSELAQRLNVQMSDPAQPPVTAK